MVVKHLMPDSDVATYLADTFSDTEQTITLLNIYNDTYSQDIEEIQAQSLDLQRIMDNVKKDTVSFRYFSEKIYTTGQQKDTTTHQPHNTWTMA